jgi:hypothetical protein
VGQPRGLWGVSGGLTKLGVISRPDPGLIKKTNQQKNIKKQTKTKKHKTKHQQQILKQKKTKNKQATHTTKTE